MKIRTLAGTLIALAAVVLASYATQRNVGLMTERFSLGDSWTVPVYAVLLVVFLAGCLPPMIVLIVQSLRRDLGVRRDRRLVRQADSARGGFRRAVDWQTDGQWGKAAADFEAVSAEQPEDFSTLLRYGRVQRLRGLTAEAVEIHRRGSVLYPQSVAMLYELAEDYEAAGETEVARQVRDRILRDFPEHGLRILRRRRNSAVAAEDWREAERLQNRIDAMLEEGDDRLELARDEGVRRGLAYERAVEHLESGRAEDAELALHRLLEEEPGFLPAVILMGEASLEREDPDGAVECWRRGYEESGNPIFLQRIEDHFIEREQPAEAIETLQRLISAAENDLLPRFFLGRLYYRLEMHEEALKVLDGLAGRIGSSPTYHLLLARIHERRGEIARSVENYRTSLQQAQVPAAEYVCRICGAASGAWSDRCIGCGSWNSIELDFEEERVSPEELGVRPGPVWVVDDAEPGEA